jgi:hypothetical protein
MTRNVPALLKGPPAVIGESVVSSQHPLLALGEPTQRSLVADPEWKYRDALH